MGLTRSEDIEAWKEARELARRVYQVTSEGKFSREFGLRDQMRRAAVSALSNIAEGFERGGDREFIQFLSQAKGSTGELKAQLYVALDVGLIARKEFEELSESATKAGRLIGGFMRDLRGSALKGSKFKPCPARDSGLGTRD